MQADYMKKIGYIILESAKEASDTKIISENNNRVTAEGTLQDGDAENRNRRCYATKDLASGIVDLRIQELIKSGNLKGEAGHPTDKDLARQQTVLPTLEQVKYTKLWMDGRYVKAHYCGTNNDLGETFNKDLLCGEKPSFSLRALGTMESKDGKAYVKNLKIITYDRVYYPSHKCAYTEKILSEAAGNSNTEANNTSINEDGTLIPITNSAVLDYIKQESGNLAVALNNFDTLFESTQLINGGKQVQIKTINNDILVVSLEQHLANDIMNYCYKKL